MALPKLPPLPALLPVLPWKSFKPTIAAVTCASVGVAGVGVTTALVTTAKGELGKDSTLLADDLALPGPLTSTTRARLAEQQQKRNSPGTAARAAKAGTPVAFEAPVSATGVASFDRTMVERRRAAERASRDKERVFAEGTPKEIAKILVLERGWSERQYECLVPMWNRESGWNPDAHNRSSGAHGIPQALPGKKMAKFGDDWRTNPVTQIRWGLWYIENRYNTPCGAWSFWQRNHWY